MYWWGLKNGGGFLEMECMGEKFIRCCVVVVLVLLAAITPVATIADTQIEKYSFNSYTVLSPSVGSSNMNRQGGAVSYVLMSAKWSYLLDDGLLIQSIPNGDADVSAVRIIGKPLVYPNPFSLSQGAELGYRLSRNADVEIRIFDMRANQIFSDKYVAGGFGGIGAYNKLQINRLTFGGYDLSSGVYFFVISSEGKVIGKGKFVVVPK